MSTIIYLAELDTPNTNAASAYSLLRGRVQGVGYKDDKGELHHCGQAYGFHLGHAKDAPEAKPMTEPEAVPEAPPVRTAEEESDWLSGGGKPVVAVPVKPKEPATPQPGQRLSLMCRIEVDAKEYAKCKGKCCVGDYPVKSAVEE